MTEPIASVFVSYAHDDKPLARAISQGLEGAGFRVWLDEGELRVGDSLIQSVGAALDQVDFVAALVSRASVNSEWCKKEISLAMTGEIGQRGVTVLPLRIDNASMPPTLKDKLYLDVDSANVPAAIDHLVRDIGRHLEPTPPLPPKRRAPVVRGVTPAPEVSEVPIRLTGIDLDHIGKPRNDGSRGSALYAVSLTLSRQAPSLWADLLVRNWDHPPTFTTMHRAGIASVVGDRIVLDGTTVDEVEKYHLETLKGSVAETNRQFADITERQRKQADAEKAAEADRVEAARNAASRLNFE